MRKIIMMLAVLASCLTLAAQETVQVKGVVIHKGDKQPMVGAEVKVKGTSIATVTDVDGRFVIDVPAGERKLEVSYIGMPSTTATIKPGEELLIKMQPAERTFMPYISVTPIIDGFMGGETEFMGFGANVGVGLTCNITQNFAISPAVEIKKSFIFLEDDLGSEFNHNPITLQIPVMFELGSWVKNTTKFIVGIGPYVGFHLGSSDSDLEYYGPEGGETYYPFRAGDELERKSMEVGGRLVYKMHWTHFMLGIHAQYGFTEAFEKELQLNYDSKTNGHPVQVGITFGYRF